MRGKKALELEMFGKLIIAIALLVLLIILIIIFKSKGMSALDFIKNLFRFKG